MHRSHRDVSADRGLTLVELLVTVTLMSIGFVGIFSAMATFYRSENTQRAVADIDDSIRSVGEQILAVPYQSCATSYAVPTPAGFTSSVSVRFWDGSMPAGFDTTCGTDLGVQLVTVRLTRTADGIADSLDVAKSR